VPDPYKPEHLAGGVSKIWLTLMLHDDSLYIK
jgi:hypothetical protein